MSASPQYGLFEVYGIEIEYMIVDAETGAVRPIADLVLEEAAGEPAASDYDAEPVAWSNELVLHVIELKMNARSAPRSARFAAEIARIDAPFAPQRAVPGRRCTRGWTRRARPASGRTSTARSTRRSTASSTAAATAGATSRACT
jgi:hypothetical protein